jgi:hypothetical protein
MTSPDDRPAPPPADPAKGPQSDRDRALAALHNFAKPQPKANPARDPGDPDPESSPASGASGFVGMLAKGQFDSGGSRTPSSGKPGENPSGKSKYSLKMARELSPNDPSPLTTPPPAPAGKDAGGGGRSVPAARRGISPAYRYVLPAMVLTALLLLLIGLWATGALLYMASISPTEPGDVHYPLVHWSFTEGELGGYTRASRMMAWSMLAALPLALVLGGAAMVMWRRLLARGTGRRKLEVGGRK